MNRYKNILAENLAKFKTKNLPAEFIQRIQEQAQVDALIRLVFPNGNYIDLWEPKNAKLLKQYETNKKPFENYGDPQTKGDKTIQKIKYTNESLLARIVDQRYKANGTQYISGEPDHLFKSGRIYRATSGYWKTLAAKYPKSNLTYGVDLDTLLRLIAAQKGNETEGENVGGIKGGTVIWNQIIGGMKNNFFSKYIIKNPSNPKSGGYAITYNGRQINDSWESFKQNALFAGILGDYQPLNPLREKAVQQLASKRGSADDLKKIGKLKKEDGSYDITQNWMDQTFHTSFITGTRSFARGEDGKMAKNPSYTDRKNTGVPPYGISLRFDVKQGADGKLYGRYEVYGVSREARGQGNSDQFDIGVINVYIDNKPNRVVLDNRIKVTQDDERWMEKRAEKGSSTTDFNDTDKKDAAKTDLENFAKRHGKTLKAKFIELVKASGIETK